MKHGTHITRYVNMSDLTGGADFEEYLARYSDLQGLALQDKGMLLLTKKEIMDYVDFHKLRQTAWGPAFLAALSAEYEQMFRVRLNA